MESAYAEYNTVATDVIEGWVQMRRETPVAIRTADLCPECAEETTAAAMARIMGPPK